MNRDLTHDCLCRDEIPVPSHHRKELGFLILMFVFVSSGSTLGVTPEQFLARAKENLCLNFLKGPSPDLRGYTWRYKVVTNTLNSKRKVLKTRPYLLIDTYRSALGIQYRVTAHHGDGVFVDERRGPLRVLTSPVFFVSLIGCHKTGEALRDIIWDLTEFGFVRWEVLEGRATGVFSYRTVPKIPKQHKTADRWIKRSLKDVVGIEGTLWIDEQDRVAVKGEGKNYRTIPMGLSPAIQKGTYWAWQLRKSGDRWLPVFLMKASPYLDNFRRRIVQGVGRFEDFRRISPVRSGEPLELPPECDGKAQLPKRQNALTKDADAQNPLLGKWVNEDPNTRGVTRLAVSSVDSCFVLEMWGKCHPFDCYWGKVIARVAEDQPGRLEATWNATFMDEFQILELRENGRLGLAGRRFYTDHSKRSEYEYTAYFVRGDFE